MQLKSFQIRELQEAVALERSETAYKVLFVQLYQSAISFTTTITKNEEVAEELYADAMMKLWFMESKLTDIKDLKLYIFILLKNSALNYLKKERKQRFVSIDDIDRGDVPQTRSVEESLVFNELENMLAQVIDKLPSKCQIVYKLIKHEGFSYKHTAEILGLSVNTIEGHMSNALKKIGTFLKSLNLKD
ncbi:sigma-70 family RNA polymerase sigma factor [Sphingobacterium arenae]|uniref:Sigma-70 family RNA polymerase sigma factor n=1 Tax=Sphingobacterium arenae TaxID=1280598 RepID=A0ABR7XYB4_9SPHI|nr:sigma-70 family RNA polymerase sigma factor [Sphingobacterium arenae]MBD1424017.1 sigma-70 family RNA polymerase sigma factor [Sphingobacterium arenae]